MGRRKYASLGTLHRQARAGENMDRVRQALREGGTLRISNRTDIAAGTVHHGTSRRLILRGEARYSTATGEAIVAKHQVEA